MKRTLGFTLSIAVTVVMLSILYSGPGATPAVAQAPKVLDGKQIFLAQKCNLCHSVPPAGIAATVKSERMKGPDLVGSPRKMPRSSTATCARRPTSTARSTRSSSRAATRRSAP